MRLDEMTREQVLIRKGKGARIEPWILIVYRSGGEAELAEEPRRTVQGGRTIAKNGK